ncbi:hypothetical protein TNCV_3907361 [Trichonephila clavipes]|nr:hypothetical protein TNCV_3907361 [Trichonephila clavipes]
MGVNDFRLTLYKRSDASHLRDEQQLLYLILEYQPKRSKCFLPGLDCVHLFVSITIISGDVERKCLPKLTVEKFFDPAFADQKTRNYT